MPGTRLNIVGTNVVGNSKKPRDTKIEKHGYAIQNKVKVDSKNHRGKQASDGYLHHTDANRTRCNPSEDQNKSEDIIISRLETMGNITVIH